MPSLQDPDYQKMYPEGIEIDDIFIAYTTEVFQDTLQFRNGKLINFDPQAVRTWLNRRHARSPGLVGDLLTPRREGGPNVRAPEPSALF